MSPTLKGVSMAFCGQCGEQLPDDMSFCSKCGACVDANSSSWPSESGRANTQVANPSPGRSEPVSSGYRAGPYDDPDRYELSQVRSRGGEGELWRGALEIDGVPLPVAVKIISESNISRLDDWSRRWQQQVEILKTLDHPSLVKVRESFIGPLPHPPGQADPNSRSLFLIMNWTKGESVVEWVARNADRDLLDSLRVVARIAAAVDYLHSGASTGKPVLHRDIKPDNVLVDGTNVCLVDFGFARLLSTEPMTLAGTPHYLAPEVVRGGTFSEASDLYALGATAYYVIVGEPPTPDDFDDMCRKLTTARGAEGRADLADHVLAMMDPEPAQRPESAVAWAQSLAAGAVSTSMPTAMMRPAADATPIPSTGKKSRTKTIALIAGVVVIVCVAAVAAFFVLRNHPATPMAANTPTPTPTIAQTTTAAAVPLDATSDATSSTSPSASAAPSSASTGSSGSVLMNLSEYAQPIDGSADTGEATIAGVAYPFSLSVTPQDQYGTDNDDSVEYNVPPGFDAFEATIGMDDSSGSTAKTTFQITNAVTGQYLFGSELHPITLRLNQARRIDVKLPKGILRITLTTVSNGSDDDWNVGIHPVWGNAQFSGPIGQATLPTPVSDGE